MWEQLGCVLLRLSEIAKWRWLGCIYSMIGSEPYSICNSRLFWTPFDTWTGGKQNHGRDKGLILIVCWLRSDRPSIARRSNEQTTTVLKTRRRAAELNPFSTWPSTWSVVPLSRLEWGGGKANWLHLLLLQRSSYPGRSARGGKENRSVKQSLALPAA